MTTLASFLLCQTLAGEQAEGVLAELRQALNLAGAEPACREFVEREIRTVLADTLAIGPVTIHRPECAEVVQRVADEYSRRLARLLLALAVAYIKLWHAGGAVED